MARKGQQPFFCQWCEAHPSYCTVTVWSSESSAWHTTWHNAATSCCASPHPQPTSRPANAGMAATSAATASAAQLRTSTAAAPYPQPPAAGPLAAAPYSSEIRSSSCTSAAVAATHAEPPLNLPCEPCPGLPSPPTKASSPGLADVKSVADTPPPPLPVSPRCALRCCRRSSLAAHGPLAAPSSVPPTPGSSIPGAWPGGGAVHVDVDVDVGGAPPRPTAVRQAGECCSSPARSCMQLPTAPRRLLSSFCVSGRLLLLLLLPSTPLSAAAVPPGAVAVGAAPLPGPPPSQTPCPGRPGPAAISCKGPSGEACDAYSVRYYEELREGPAMLGQGPTGSPEWCVSGPAAQRLCTDRQTLSTTQASAAAKTPCIYRGQARPVQHAI